jgi:hypothetical protein
MKKIVGLAVLLIVVAATVSCASPPNWTGTETAAGDYVWVPSPGTRAYFNFALLGGIFVYFIYNFIKSIRGHEPVGCILFIVLIVGFFLYVNTRDFIWHESYTVDSSGITHSYYNNVWKTTKRSDRIEWRDVDYIGYSSGKTLEQTTWVRVYRSTGERVYPEGGGETEEGKTGRVIRFSSAYGEKFIDVILEKQSYNEEYPQWMMIVWGWIFGTEDYVISPEEEERLKLAIMKRLPKATRQEMSPEARAYLLTH